MAAATSGLLATVISGFYAMNNNFSLPVLEQLSIRKRLGLGVAILVLPLLVITFSGYLLLHYSLEMVELMHEDVAEEFIPVTTLRERILRSVMPANDYLIHGNLNEREQFQLLRREVDHAFTTVLAIRFTDPQKTIRIQNSHALWQKVVQLNHDILFLEHPLGNASGASNMEQLDWLVDQIHSQLEYVSALTINELRTRHELLHQMRLKISAVIIVFLITVSLVVLAGSLLIRRWVITPLAELESGAQQLADGQLDYRINVNTKDEISKVAHTFNVMAAALKHERETLHSLAVHDNLTGLFNRKEFERLMTIELMRASRHNLELAVLMVDIDFFKNVNDQYGHSAGDAVLKNVASRLSDSLRPSDVLARYGGEEFIVMLPQTSLQGAAALGERLCAQVRAAPIVVSSRIQPVITISVGIAMYTADLDNITSLVDAADKALYAAKNTGRNRIYLYQDL